MTLGQRIQEHRLRLGLSQAGLGEKLGVSRQAVSRWEADGAVPDTDKLIALSKLFGLTLNELLQVESPPEPPPAPVEKPAEQRPRVRWKPLLLAAVCFLAGLAVGRAPDIAARLGPLEPREAIADWSFRASGPAYELDGREVVDFYMGVTLEDTPALEGTEVFFLIETAGGETLRPELVDVRESLYGITYQAFATVPNEGMSLSVGFRKHGQERLQILDEYGRPVPSQG